MFGQTSSFLEYSELQYHLTVDKRGIAKKLFFDYQCYK